MKKACKVTSQIEDIENHFKKKFSPDVSATHPIQPTLPKTFDRIINIEEAQNAIKNLIMENAKTMKVLLLNL